jgi:hypothetical protein
MLSDKLLSSHVMKEMEGNWKVTYPSRPAQAVVLVLLAAVAVNVLDNAMKRVLLTTKACHL